MAFSIRDGFTLEGKVPAVKGPKVDGKDAVIMPELNFRFRPPVLAESLEFDEAKRASLTLKTPAERAKALAKCAFDFLAKKVLSWDVTAPHQEEPDLEKAQPVSVEILAQLPDYYVQSMVSQVADSGNGLDEKN